MTTAAEPITVVMMPKALALGVLSLKTAVAGGYAPLGGQLELKRGMSGVDGALDHFGQVVALTPRRAPKVLDGLRQDADLEAEFAPRVYRYAKTLRREGES
jgi:hypothetical protein